MRYPALLVPLLLLAAAQAGEFEQTFRDWARKSATHARVIDLLSEHVQLMHPPQARKIEDFQRLQAEEQRILASLGEIGSEAVLPLRDMIVAWDEPDLAAARLLATRALARAEGEAVVPALKQVLTQVEAPAVHTIIAREIRSTPAAAALLAETLLTHEDARLSAIYLREVCRRAEWKTEQRALLSKLLSEEKRAEVLAEAVALAGGTGDASLLEPLKGVWTRCPETAVRQRVVVAVAEVGRDGALAWIDEVTREGPLPERASAVLAFGRIGTPRALELLEALAGADPQPEVRARARRLADALRAQLERQKQQD